MALLAIDAFCDGCGEQFHATPTHSFLGFQKLRCPACGAKLLYPLTRGYRAFYRGCALFMGLGLVGSIATGHFMAPGLIGCAMLGGLVKDHDIRKELLADARARAAIGRARTPSPTLVRLARAARNGLFSPSCSQGNPRCPC